ncbi:MAG: DUF2341 domain-containing protein [Candidatus Aenigmatarchaeota archaeon]
MKLLFIFSKINIPILILFLLCFLVTFEVVESAKYFLNSIVESCNTYNPDKISREDGIYATYGYGGNCIKNCAYFAYTIYDFGRETSFSYIYIRGANGFGCYRAFCGASESVKIGISLDGKNWVCNVYSGQGLPTNSLGSTTFYFGQTLRARYVVIYRGAGGPARGNPIVDCIAFCDNYEECRNCLPTNLCTITLNSLSINPSSTNQCGQSILLTATVSYSASGNCQNQYITVYKPDGSVLCNIPIDTSKNSNSCSASYTTPSQSGTYTFKAVYRTQEKTASLNVNCPSRNPLWITYFSNVSQAFVNQPIQFSSLWNASQQYSTSVWLSHFVFSYRLNNNPWVNETYRFSANVGSWLSNWKYRIPITIKENSGKDLTNYQILVALNTQSLISQGKMKSDCSDIRFVDSDGITLLNYWIESGCNTQNTRIWVKVPNIPANSYKTIYVYYGNPSATSLSNGDLVFDFFDEFLNKNISKWDWPSNWIVENGFAKQTYSAGWSNGMNSKQLNIPISNYLGIRIISNIINDGTSWAYDVQIGVKTSNTIFGSPYFTESSNWYLFFDRSCSGSGNCPSGYTRSLRRYEVIILGNRQQWYLDGNLIDSRNLNINGIIISGFYINGKGITRFDKFIVSKYAFPEPTITLGNEETINIFTAWANITKIFSQPGTLCWKFYANNSLNLWNVTPESCLNIIVPDYYFEITLVQPKENSINNLIVGESLNVKAHVKMLSNYQFCININAYIRYNQTSNIPETPIPTTSNSLSSDINPISTQICTSQTINLDYILYANKPSFKIIDIRVCDDQNLKCNNSKTFYANISLVANRDFSLKSGWNLISIPYKSIHLDLSQDFCNLSEKLFHYYNSSSKTWQYHRFNELKYGIAYWVYSDKDCTSKISISGNVNINDLPKTQRGINYIGSLTSNRDVNSIASAIGCNNPKVRYWDPTSQSFKDANQIIPWYGYIFECS